LTKPSIPSWLANPFVSLIVGNIVNFGRDIVIKGGKVEVANMFPDRTYQSGNIVLRTPVGEEGIRPGETIIVGEETSGESIYKEAVENKACEMGAKIGIEIDECCTKSLYIDDKKWGTLSFGFCKGLIFKRPEK
jgi:hypothetical protein